MNKRLATLLNEILSALRAPTAKQKEAYGRMSHTLSSACLIGGVTLTFAASQAGSSAAMKVSSLFFWGVVLFLAGAIFSKGE